ncbi:MAG: hypothetical protein EXR74_00640 [Bdellovibrionales bacterium]|nr:hypothetical protein [Bdellovibrionales bacterium]
MAKLSRYFTPTLGKKDKETILTSLGLSGASFRLLENVATQNLFTQNWGETGPKTEITEFSNRGSEVAQIELMEQQISVEHMVWGGASLAFPKEKKLFEAILPYPHALFFTGENKDLNIQFAPEAFSKKMVSLRLLANQLEDALSHFELSVLWIRNSESAFPLLFHFVRKKLIRVGTLSSLLELGAKFEQEGLSPSDLRQFFGTNAAFFSLDLRGSHKPLSPWDSLIGSITQCLTEQSARVVGESLQSIDSPPLLDFEL